MGGWIVGRRRGGWRAHAVVLAALTLAMLVPAGAAQAMSVFSPTGPWNAPIGASPTIDPNSGPIVSQMSNTIATKMSGSPAKYPNISTTQYSTPVYVVGPGTPKRPIKMDSTNTALSNAIVADHGVPFPAGAQPADGTDGHIVVYDQTSQKMYEFWRASSPEQNKLTCIDRLDWGQLCFRDGQWHAAWGGIMDNVDTDDGVFSDQSWSGAGSEGWHWGATATSLPLLGGLITFDDLRAGVMNHAVAAAFVNMCSEYFVAPAQREDGTDASANCLPEGTRLQLDPSYDVNADSNPPLTKMVERAAQTYGIIVRDKTGDSFGFYGQDPLTEPSNPYTSGPGVGGVNNGNLGFFGGLAPWQLFRNFPFSRLRVIQSTHCTTAPCR